MPWCRPGCRRIVEVEVADVVGDAGGGLGVDRLAPGDVEFGAPGVEEAVDRRVGVLLRIRRATRVVLGVVIVVGVDVAQPPEEQRVELALGLPVEPHPEVELFDGHVDSDVGEIGRDDLGGGDGFGVFGGDHQPMGSERWPAARSNARACPGPHRVSGLRCSGHTR